MPDNKKPLTPEEMDAHILELLTQRVPDFIKPADFTEASALAAPPQRPLPTLEQIAGLRARVTAEPRALPTLSQISALRERATPARGNLSAAVSSQDAPTSPGPERTLPHEDPLLGEALRRIVFTRMLNLGKVTDDELDRIHRPAQTRRKK